MGNIERELRARERAQRQVVEQVAAVDEVDRQRREDAARRELRLEIPRALERLRRVNYAGASPIYYRRLWLLGRKGTKYGWQVFHHSDGEGWQTYSYTVYLLSSGRLCSGGFLRRIRKIYSVEGVLAGVRNLGQPQVGPS